MKALALENILSISVTDDVSHEPISSLNESSSSKSSFIVVIPDVHVVGSLLKSLVLTRSLTSVSSLLVYVVLLTSPVSPTLALGHIIVTPLLAK